MHELCEFDQDKPMLTQDAYRRIMERWPYGEREVKPYITRQTAPTLRDKWLHGKPKAWARPLVALVRWWLRMDAGD